MAASTILVLCLVCLLTAVNGQFDLIGSAEETLDSNSPVAAAQQVGGNYAGYGESCALQFTNGKLCISSRLLVCDNGRCKCDINKEDAAIPMIYVNNTDVQKCAPVAHVRNEFACTWNAQCTEGQYGENSQCYRGKCQCYDPTGNREVILHENTCYVKKTIGSSCANDEECNVTIKGEAICFGTLSRAGLCQCANGYAWEETATQECLPLRTINETCQSDFQCNDREALGKLSRCTLGMCQCYDTLDSIIRRNTSYYIPNPNPTGIKGKCFFVKKANETCTSAEECILGYHANAVCKVHPSYNDEFVCQCVEPGKCKASSIALSTIAIVGALLIFFSNTISPNNKHIFV